MLRNITLLLFSIVVISCSNQQARKPISHSSGTFIKESIERNKKLNNSEEAIIKAFIQKDSTKHYSASTKGYWFSYDKKIEENTNLPIRGDITYFDYEIKNLKGELIYSKEELKPQEYYVDKQNIMTGIREAIKTMKKGEVVTFLFPSHIAFGYHGDNNKIGTNEPLLCTISLNDIKRDSNPKQ